MVVLTISTSGMVNSIIKDMRIGLFIVLLEVIKVNIVVVYMEVIIVWFREIIFLLAKL